MAMLSLLSGPASTPNKSAASSTVLVMGPAQSSVVAEGTMPRVLTRPNDGLNPTTPQCDEGMRIDPPSSLPTEPKQSPAATAAPEPPDDPPVIRAKFHGL